jgi:hypothetical protein
MTTETPDIFYSRWQNDTREPLVRWRDMPLTWSQINAFRMNKKQWYRTYFLGKKGHQTKEMLFGNYIGNKLATDPSFMPEISRLEHFEYVVEARMGKIRLRGHLDNYSPGVLHEFKTGKAPWTQKRAVEHGQLDLYTALLYLSEKLHPEQLSTTLFWLPTKEAYDEDEHGITPTVELTGEVHRFEVKKGLRDIVNILSEVKRIHREMEEYVAS